MPRPNEPLIVPETVIKTALEIIDDGGVDAFGLDSLARRLGISAPSLYHHFSGKSEILAQVARLVLFEVRVPREPRPEQWPEFFVAIATSFRRAILRHPNTVSILVEYFPRRFALSTYERSAQLLERAGIPVELHAMALEGLDRLTFGSALFAAMKVANGESGPFPGLDPERDPSLVRAMRANRWPDDERLFQETVRRFLQGVATEAV
jgi:AcrR family transcriptional regulator